MTGARDQRRGQPMRFLAMVLVLWTAGRIVLWESPFPEIAIPAPPALLARQSVQASGAARAVGVNPVLPERAAPASVIAPPARPLAPVPHAARTWLASPMPHLPASAPVATGDEGLFLRGRRAAGHNLLWAAAMQGLPVPAALAARFEGRASAAPAPRLAIAPRPERWHFDGWVQLRRGGTEGAGGSQAASLGGSQAGAVARFTLAPDTAFKPEALLRAGFTPAQAGISERAEAGLGLRVTPFARLPLVAQAELRAVTQGGRVRAVPVALIAGGVDDVALPVNVRLRAYGEAGWSGEDGAGLFADGQAALTRTLANGARGSLDAGIGTWAGAQRGAARLDVGPLLAFDAPLARGKARLQLDYRLRVAGSAEPVSGPALTLSTSF